MNTPPPTERVLPEEGLAAVENQSAIDTNPLPVWPSDRLLGGQKVVAIEHNGALYRLQSTRAGKLILTK